MQAPAWLRRARWLRSFRALEAASFFLFCLFLWVAVARGWYRMVPGLGPAIDTVVATDAGEPGSHDHDHSGHDHEHPGHDGDDHGDHERHDHAAHEEHDHASADHEDEHHDEGEMVALSEQARKGLNLRTGELQPETFWRHISAPATVVAWPGRTHVHVAAPLTGTVTAVHVTSGETVSSGALLYTLRLTHQDLVRTQAEFLQTLGKADVGEREVQRLADVAQSGAIARKSLLERQYELDKLQAELRAQREALLLHGLSEDQVQRIEQRRQLIREVQIEAPTLHADWSLHDDALIHPESRVAARPIDGQAAPVAEDENGAQHVETDFVVTELQVRRGESVETGQTLTVLADYAHLYAEGRAFQQDAELISKAMTNEWAVQAVFENGDEPTRIIDGLQIAYIGGEVGIASRALPFYVPLNNEVIEQEQRGDHTYTTWRFKPGQRLRLRLPVQRRDGVFVVPVAAIAKEGAEHYIFVDHGNHLARRSVHVVMRDQLQVAIANDGSVRPGETIALNAAHQLQLAFENQTAGPIDPHAGHNH